MAEAKANNETIIHGTVEGLVQGNYNTVTNEYIDRGGQINWDTRLIPAKDLRLESFKLGDTAAAKFPYVITPIQEIYNDSIQALKLASSDKDSAKHGILVLGEANAGKTRLALEALRQALPTWPVLRWRVDSTRDDLPPVEYLSGKSLIYFIDDLQDYISIQATTDPRAIMLRTIFETLAQAAECIIVVATCRLEDRSRVRVTLNWLFNQLTNIILPSFSADVKDTEAMQIIAEFQKKSTVHVEDWDGTLGSLVLGLSTKNSQYLDLFEHYPLAATILHAMKLLTQSTTTLHNESLLRTVCKDVFDWTDIQEKTWREAVNKLILMQFVTSDINGSDVALTIRKDTYFDKVITEYPLPFQPQQIKLDLIRLKKVFVERKEKETLLDLGFTFSDLDLSEEALDCLETVLSINSTDANAWYLKGLTLSILNRDDEALGSFDQTLALDPNNVDAWYQRGLTLSILNRDEEAIAAFKQTLLLDPDNEEARVRKSRLLSSQKRNEEALDALNHTLILDPNIAYAWFAKSHTLYMLDRNDEALEALDHTLTLNPKDADVWSWKGYTLGVLGRDTEALEALDHALTLDPLVKIVQQLEKQFHDIKNRNKKILTTFDHNLAIDPNNATAWYLKAVSLIEIDQEQNKRTSVTSNDVLTPASSSNITLRKMDVLLALGKEKEARRAESKSKKHSK